ncbi:Cystathionine beta-lyase PatB [compost metagenome]
MQYNFDEIIDRKGTNSVSFEGWKGYMFGTNGDKTFPFTEEEYIRMWVADMDFATPPEILDAIRARLDRQILGYTLIFDPAYFETLKQWFRKRYAWEINTDHIVTSPGVVPALNRLVNLLTSAGESILINTPSYTPFKVSGDINNRSVYYSPLVQLNGDYELSFEDIIQQLDDPEKNIKVFILCNPHNPTGRVWTETELHKIGEICLERNIWLISDEIHCDLLRKGISHTPLAKLFPDSERIITCTAPSKTFNLAGNLMSHIFIPDEQIRKQWLIQYFDLLSPLSVAAAQAAYAHCEDWLEQLKAYLDGNFRYLSEQLNTYLPECNFNIPDATYLAWIDFSAYIPHIPYSNISEFFALEAGVLLEGGNMFVDNGDGYIRLNLACPKSVLAEGLKRIIYAIQQHIS